IWPLSVQERSSSRTAAPPCDRPTPARAAGPPANGPLPWEGWAEDDWGFPAMTLRMKLLPGKTPGGPALPELAPKPYRDGKSFKLVDGTYPRELKYKDFIALDEIKTARNEKFALTKGMVLEYWLEATDNSDSPNPKGNVTPSKSFKVT